MVCSLIGNSSTNLIEQLQAVGIGSNVQPLFNLLSKHPISTAKGAVKYCEWQALWTRNRNFFFCFKQSRHFSLSANHSCICLHPQIFTRELTEGHSYSARVCTSAGCSVAVTRGSQQGRGPVFEQHHSTTWRARNNRKEEHTTLHSFVAPATAWHTIGLWTHAEPKGARSLACTLGRGTSIGALGKGVGRMCVKTGVVLASKKRSAPRVVCLSRGCSLPEIAQNFADIAHSASTSRSLTAAESATNFHPWSQGCTRRCRQKEWGVQKWRSKPNFVSSWNVQTGLFFLSMLLTKATTLAKTAVWHSWVSPVQSVLGSTLQKKFPCGRDTAGGGQRRQFSPKRHCRSLARLPSVVRALYPQYGDHKYLNFALSSDGRRALTELHQGNVRRLK